MLELYGCQHNVHHSRAWRNHFGWCTSSNIRWTETTNHSEMRPNAVTSLRQRTSRCLGPGRGSWGVPFAKQTTASASTPRDGDQPPLEWIERWRQRSPASDKRQLCQTFEGQTSQCRDAVRVGCIEERRSVTRGRGWEDYLPPLPPPRSTSRWSACPCPATQHTQV